MSSVPIRATVRQQGTSFYATVQGKRVSGMLASRADALAWIYKHIIRKAS